MFLVIKAGHFVAGVEVGKRAAPIIKYMADWNRGRIEQYCFWKGWEVEEVKDPYDEINLENVNLNPGTAG